MKIGILTLSASDNCGSLLQAYALQEYLQKTSRYEVEIIDYKSKEAKKLYRTIHPSYIKKPRKFLDSIVHYSALIKQKQDYENFKNKFLNLTSKQFKNKQDLDTIDNYYDIVICGSDQIWNTCMFDFSDVFLLSWCKSKKVAYAASLGDQEDKDEFGDMNKYLSNLQEFAELSVRESSSKLKLEKLLKKYVSLCVDPTLLLTKSDWDKLVKKNHIDIEYIFYYSYNYGNDNFNFMVKKMAERLGLPVYVINASRWVGKNLDDLGFLLYEFGGPNAFLSLMKNAQYTFVESFHGTIFSYIFERNFWFLKDSNKIKIDDRIEGILKLIGLQDRIITADIMCNINISQEIDYTSTPDTLKNARKESMEFISEALKNKTD